jgi:PrcB C-terminal
MPKIDFERNVVIVAAMGSKPSTGFAITIDSVVTRRSSVEVHATLSSLGDFCIQNPMLTNPVDMVEVARSVATVVFRDRQEIMECKMP